jgi:hypothetical protein
VSYTTFPPYFQMENDTDPSTLNKRTLEYYYIRLFLDKYRQVPFRYCSVFKKRKKGKMESLKLSKRRLKVAFKDANFLWGAWDNKTKSWNGVVGQVGTENKKGA